MTQTTLAAFTLSFLVISSGCQGDLPDASDSSPDALAPRAGGSYVARAALPPPISPAVAPAGFTETWRIHLTSPPGSMTTWLADRPGMRYVGMKMAWVLMQPDAPSNLNQVDLADYKFSDPTHTTAISNLDDLLEGIHQYDGVLRVKVMPMYGNWAPEWIYSHPTHPVQRLRKIQVGAGNPVGFARSSPVPWDPNLRFWSQRWLDAWKQWLALPCTQTGSYTSPHTHAAHFWAMNVGMPATDENTEMPDSYESAPVAFASGGLQANIDADDTAVKTNIPISSLGTMTEGMIVLGSGGTKEAIFFTSVTDWGGGLAQFNVAPSSIVEPGGTHTGRGWNGGIAPEADGFNGNGPARSWNQGTGVKVLTNGQPATFGEPGAHQSFTFTGTGGAPDFTLTGIFSSGAVNKNQWVRTGMNAPGPFASYSRAGSVVVKTSTASATSEVGRLAISARAWMDAADDLFDAMPPSIQVWMMGGRIWGADGAVGINNYDPISPNDAVRDYLSTTDLARAKNRMFWGYTTAYANVDGADPAARRFDIAGLDQQWYYDSCMTMVGRGFRIAMQVKAGGAPTPRALDYMYTMEVLMRKFGSKLRFIESGQDLSPKSMNQYQSVPNDWSLTYPASLGTAWMDETGSPSSGIVPNPGTADSTPNKRFHDFLFGKTYQGGGAASVDPAMATYNIDARMKRFETPVAAADLAAAP